MKWLTLAFARYAFNSRRAEIYRKMAFAFQRGGTPKTEFAAYYKNAKEYKSALTPIYRDWHESLRGSAAGRMALAMKGTIPDSDYSLIAVAEENMSLPDGLEFLAISVERVNEMRSSLVDAVRFVALPMLLIIGGVLGIDAYFFPLLEETVARRDWPIVTKLVASVAHQMGSIATLTVALMPALIFLWLWSLPRLKGKPRIYLEKLPLLYSKYRDYQCVMFQMNLAFLREANVSPRVALVRIQKFSTPYMAWHIERMLSRLTKKAENFGDVLVSSGLFNKDLAELLSDYSRYTDWHTQMRTIANSSLNIVAADVKKLGPRLQTTLQLSIGALMFTIMAAAAAAMAKVMLQVR